MLFTLTCTYRTDTHTNLNTQKKSVFYKQLNRSVIILYYPYVGRCLVYFGMIFFLTNSLLFVSIIYAKILAVLFEQGYFVLFYFLFTEMVVFFHTLGSCSSVCLLTDVYEFHVRQSFLPIIFVILFDD